MRTPNCLGDLNPTPSSATILAVVMLDMASPNTFSLTFCQGFCFCFAQKGNVTK